MTPRPASRPSCSLNLNRSHAFRFFQSQGFDSILAQDELLHLATARQGIGLDELEVARDLLVADLSSAVLSQFLLGQLLSRFRDDHCHQFLTEDVFWHP